MNQVNAIKGINPAIQGINSAQALQGGAAFGALTAKKSPSDSTVGVNTNIGVGDTSFIAAQAGKKAGMGRTLGFA